MIGNQDLQQLSIQYRHLASECAETARTMPASKWQTAWWKLARHLSELADEIDGVLCMPSGNSWLH